MQHSFWHEAWAANQIGFHQNDVNTLLLKHWSSLNLADNGTVLVPLCGKSLDLVWLRSQGYSVVGLELSEIALDQLAQSLTEKLGISIKKTRLDQAGLTAKYEGEGVLLIAGDFFAASAGLIGKVEATYDRAAIVALPADMRLAYCKHLQEISQQAPQLLFTFDYNQSEMSGPPFSVPAAEIHTHYQPYYEHIELLEVREIIDHEPKFRDRGLSSFKQLVYLIS